MESKALEIFRQHNGQLKMSQAISCGITRYMLYSMYNRGILEKVTRGIYRLKELGPISNPDLVTVAIRYPKVVICLVSALAFHEMTTQIPHEVSVSVLKDSRRVDIQSPPVKTHKFSKASYEAGIEEFKIDGVVVRMYNPEKSLADCFKFRNKIGMDIFLEAIKLYKSRFKPKLSDIMRYAKICRVDSLIRPYVESILT
ncbi:MAG: transcriptional regulator [Proteobacteria bacterium]|nr:transcriptional regulator [Pseudomonadota bacterium]